MDGRRWREHSVGDGDGDGGSDDGGDGGGDGGGDDVDGGNDGGGSGDSDGGLLRQSRPHAAARAGLQDPGPKPLHGALGEAGVGASPRT